MFFLLCWEHVQTQNTVHCNLYWHALTLPSYTNTQLHHSHVTSLQHSIWWSLFSGYCDSLFFWSFPPSSPATSELGRNSSGVLFIQCITTVSVCLSLSYLYLKLECFTYSCMSFYIILALNFVSQQRFSILSLHLSAGFLWLLLQRRKKTWCMILSNETLGNQITFFCLVDVLHYCAWLRACCWNAVGKCSLYIGFESVE